MTDTLQVNMNIPLEDNDSVEMVEVEEEKDERYYLREKKLWIEFQ